MTITQDEFAAFPVHDWVGPNGAPVENNRFGVAPPLSGASLLQLITNLITNPSFETNTTGWTSDDGAGTLTRTRAAAAVGGWGLQCVTSGTANTGARSPAVSLTAGTQYQACVYVFVPSSTLAVEVIVEDASFVAKATVSVTANTTPQLVRVPVVPTGTGNHYLRIRRTPASVSTLLIDGALIAASPYDQVYFDGDQPDSNWTGTAHASTSQKRLDRYNNQPASSWAILSSADWTTTP